MGNGGTAPCRRRPVQAQGVPGCQGDLRDVAQGGSRRRARKSSARHDLSKARGDGVPFRQGRPSHAARTRPSAARSWRATAPADRAEAFSLLGSNAKTRWLDDWRDVAADARGRSARCAQRILSMPSTPTSKHLPRIWPASIPVSMRLRCSGSRAISRRGRPMPGKRRSKTPTRREARSRTATHARKRIAASLNLTLGIDPVFKVKEDEGDPWAAIARADVLFLTIDKPTRIENEYRKALARVRNDPFSISADAPQHRDLRVARPACRQRDAGAGCHRRGAGRRGNKTDAGTIVAGGPLHRTHDR